MLVYNTIGTVYVYCQTLLSTVLFGLFYAVVLFVFVLWCLNEMCVKIK